MIGISQHDLEIQQAAPTGALHVREDCRFSMPGIKVPIKVGWTPEGVTANSRRKPGQPKGKRALTDRAAGVFYEVIFEDLAGKRTREVQYRGV